MRDKFKKLYEFITAPIYNRLSRDVTLTIQALLVGSMANQEVTLTKLLDDMAGFHLELEALKAKLQTNSVPLITESEEAIIKLISKADSNLSLIKLANEHQIPTSALFEWKSKYGGMTLAVLKKVRKLEFENQRLEQENCLLRNNVSKVSESKEHPSLKVSSQTGTSQSGT